MLHPLKVPDMFDHDLAQGPLGPFTRLDQGRHLTAQGRIVENAEINPKQGVILGRKLLPEILGNHFNVIPDSRQS